MNREVLDCADVRRSFVAGHVPSGPAVEAHLAGCPECRELFEGDAALGRRLGGAVQPELDPAGLFALVERDIAQDVGPRAKLRAWPTPLRAFLLIGAALLLLVSQLWLSPRPNLGVYSPAVFWTGVVVLGASIEM